MDLRIEHCERRMSDEQYDESLHTAQSPFYFFMRNTNPRSPDYGLSLWVGVPSFDYRYERLSDEEYVQWDIGTATYIYAIPPRSIWGDVSFHDREWHSARLDLLPLIRRGVAAMQAEGQFVHTMPEDLELDGHELRVGSPRHFRRRTANPQPEYPDRRVARSDGRSFSSRNDGWGEIQPISAKSGSRCEIAQPIATARPETGNSVAYRRTASE